MYSRLGHRPTPRARQRAPLRGSLLAASAARFGPSALKVRSFWMDYHDCVLFVDSNFTTVFNFICKKSFTELYILKQMNNKLCSQHFIFRSWPWLLNKNVFTYVHHNYIIYIISYCIKSYYILPWSCSCVRVVILTHANREVCPNRIDTRFLSIISKDVRFRKLSWQKSC